MNKQIYLGGTPLIDLTGYATESYVDTAVENVDVTDQLSNYALKSALDASIDAVDASIKNSDASIASIKTILGQITGDGAEVTAAIDTFNELKAFVADYTTANDLSTLIATVKSEAVDDASADAASKYQPIGSYLVADDISTFVSAGDVASAINSSIAALDLGNTYQAKGDYLVADDISTFITENDASVYLVADDISIFVTNSSLSTNYYQKGAVNDMLEVISNSINSLSGDVNNKASKNDISAFITSNDVSNLITSADAATTYLSKTDAATTYVTINDASNHVQSSDVLHIVKCTSTDYANIQDKDNKTLYIVTE